MKLKELKSVVVKNRKKIIAGALIITMGLGYLSISKGEVSANDKLLVKELDNQEVDLKDKSIEESNEIAKEVAVDELDKEVKENVEVKEEVEAEVKEKTNSSKETVENKTNVKTNESSPSNTSVSSSKENNKTESKPVQSNGSSTSNKPSNESTNNKTESTTNKPATKPVEKPEVEKHVCKFDIAYEYIVQEATTKEVETTTYVDGQLFPEDGTWYPNTEPDKIVAHGKYLVSIGKVGNRSSKKMPFTSKETVQVPAVTETRYKCACQK